VEIDPTKLQEIYSTLTQCQSLLTRSESQVMELEKRIRELEQDGVRLESTILQVLEAKKDSVQRFDKYQSVSSNVQTLMEWKANNDSRMDKLATSLWGSVATGIVGFVGMTVLVYFSSSIKPAKAIEVLIPKVKMTSDNLLIYGQNFDT
jgi:predicted RNase H-like nuclease (RuvC/YqgF family)